MNFKDILKMTGLKMTEFSEYFRIPYRTIQQWNAGTSTPPEYVLSLLKESIEHDQHFEKAYNFPYIDENFNDVLAFNPDNPGEVLTIRATSPTNALKSFLGYVYAYYHEKGYISRSNDFDCIIMATDNDVKAFINIQVKLVEV